MKFSQEFLENVTQAEALKIIRSVGAVRATLSGSKCWILPIIHDSFHQIGTPGGDAVDALRYAVSHNLIPVAEDKFGDIQ